MTKYIFVTGGVVSGLGKGITAASLGRLLKQRGLKVAAQKLDPYMNVDPGTMSPFQHGEVFVTDDGAETDLDLGHYERFIDENLTKLSSLTSGNVYWNVLERERAGEYLGGTVQVIPHVTGAIKDFIYAGAENSRADVLITEIGGTAGDIESQPFLEAIRQIALEKGRENCLFIHVTLVPYLKCSGEHKSKPTQHSVKELRAMGIFPNVIIARADEPICGDIKEKIALFCNVKADCVIENITVPSLYKAPIMLHQNGLDTVVCRELGMDTPEPDLTEWLMMTQKITARTQNITIAIVGKYVKLHDAYLSIIESLNHAGFESGVNISIRWIDCEDVTDESAGNLLSGIHGMIIPGGFGDRGIEGKIAACRYARENDIPFLGICLGMQIAVIEYARHVCGLADAHSGEFDEAATHRVIDIMPDQVGRVGSGGTMRLGSYPCKIVQGTLLHRLYNTDEVDERHRHRFELNNDYRKILACKGLVLCGTSPDENLIEAVELPDNRFFLGVQFHPEFKSRPNKPHPIFLGLVQATLTHMTKVYRCFVEKKPGFDISAQALQTELSGFLRLPQVAVRIFNRYDIQNLPPESWQDVMHTVLSEPMSGDCYEDCLPPLSDGVRLLFVESLPGQFDRRADSCEQCVQMLLGGQRPVVKTAQVFAIEGIEDADFNRVKEYLINPVECREASPDKPKTLPGTGNRSPDGIPIVEGFIGLDADSLDALRVRLNLAISPSDLHMIQAYFVSERRNPTLTELRVMDTYWSDHCRHTTFNTVIQSANIHDERVSKAYELFLSVNGDQPVTLMRIATAAMRHLHRRGDLPMLDVSEENNACTVKIKADFAEGTEDWLLFFKNETHNHPTEIEPYGGASTCIGGAIRDPLSARAYVYQSMRITGSGDPRKPIEETLPGKLPQRKLTVTAAEGFSSYGNQIGLATGYVKELYHEGYVAKRLEAGAVVAAAPQSSVRREPPSPGDVVVLLGGRTGRDGIGGATGSSKTHGTDTVAQCAAEVQKGNAPEERKLQRLFRNTNVTKLIKRCNDFGAGGASVAIGELTGGIEINLDAIPTKYDGLDGTELALSESQERMAVVVTASDWPALFKYAEAENVEATVVARVSECQRLVMIWRGQKIVDIDRAFLDTNGAQRYASVHVPKPAPQLKSKQQPSGCVSDRCADLNFCSQKGLIERFDSTIGSASVFAPLGGRYALTETQVMAAMLPKYGSRTASVMAYGFDPYFTERDPFAGSAYAVVTSVAKLIASGVPLDTIHLSLQEYFPRMNEAPTRWGLPFAAMLGAFSAQMGLKIAAIGGKDSMSGSFGELDVPPTLISFAVGIGEAAGLISPEFKGAGHPVYLLETPMLSDDLATGGLPDYEALRTAWERYAVLCRSGKVLSAWACEMGGAYGGIIKMALGNGIGFSCNADEELLNRHWGSLIFEAESELEGFRLLGYTQSESALAFGEDSVTLAELRTAWESPLENVFPTQTTQQTPQNGDVPIITDNRQSAPRSGAAFAKPKAAKPKAAKPKAVIPVFPGTNCEYDTAAAIERAGGVTEMVLIRNLTPEMLQASVAELEKAIVSAQMIVFPGGFSGGDEPDGSGKYIVSLFRNGHLADAVHDLLSRRDGLILGICNGFQALIKLGLLPNGRISAMTADCPTLTFNRIGRHQSRYVATRIASTLSPWLSKCSPGEMYVQPISHGEGRFTASPETLNALMSNGQIAFQYVDEGGGPSMDIAYNPNGSDWAIEGLCSPDGRVLGKMAHSERYGGHVAKNVPGNKFMPLFEGGVGYFQ